MEIPFPSFEDSYGLIWPRMESIQLAWAHPGQKYHPTPGNISGVLVERAEGFWTGVIQIHILPRHVIAQGFADEIAMWAARLDGQAHTTRIPHKRLAGNFIPQAGVKLKYRRLIDGQYFYDIPKTDILEGFQDYSKTYTGMFLEISAGKDVAKRIIRLNKPLVDSTRAGHTTLEFTPSLKFPTIEDDSVTDATVIRPTDTVLTRAGSDRPILDSRTVNAAGPWVYAWKEELLP